MPKSTLSLKATVTRRQAELVPTDMAERFRQLQHHQATEAVQATDAAADTPEPASPEPEKSGKQLKREAVAVQSAFLTGNLGRPVSVFLINGIKLAGKLRQFDQFTLLIEGQDGVSSLVFKHAACTIVPSSR